MHMRRECHGAVAALLERHYNSLPNHGAKNMRVMLLAGVTLALSTTAFAQALSGTQIRQALVGKTISGIENGEAYSEYLSPDGAISGRSSSGVYSGRWRILDNEICFLYEEDAGRGGKWDCNEVRLRGNQIIWEDNSTATVSGGGAR
jgi:hypothetical protein